MIVAFVILVINLLYCVVLLSHRFSVIKKQREMIAAILIEGSKICYVNGERYIIRVEKG